MILDELDLLRLKLRDHLNTMADEISGGSATDYADYQHMVGVIKGLALAERELLDLKQRLSTDSGE